MNNSNSHLQKKSKLNRLGIYIVLNMLMVVMVGKGVVHLSKGLPVGFGELLLGTIVLIGMPWVQDNTRDANPDWAMTLWWLVPMGFFAIYAYFSMINPFI